MDRVSRGNEVNATYGDSVLQIYAVTYSKVGSSLYVSSMAFTVSNQNQYLYMNGYPGYELNGTVSYDGNSVNGIVASELNGRPYYDTFDGKRRAYLGIGDSIVLSLRKVDGEESCVVSS